MKNAASLALCLVLLAACNRLPTLTTQILEQAEQKWAAHKPGMYSLVIEMSGDRVETGKVLRLVPDGLSRYVKDFVCSVEGIVIAVRSGKYDDTNFRHAASPGETKL